MMNRNDKRKNKQKRIIEKQQNTLPIKSKYIIEYKKYQSDYRKYSIWMDYDTYPNERKMLESYEKLIKIEDQNEKHIPKYKRNHYRIKDV